MFRLGSGVRGLPSCQYAGIPGSSGQGRGVCLLLVPVRSWRDTCARSHEKTGQKQMRKSTEKATDEPTNQPNPHVADARSSSADKGQAQDLQHVTIRRDARRGLSDGIRRWSSKLRNQETPGTVQSVYTTRAMCRCKSRRGEPSKAGGWGDVLPAPLTPTDSAKFG